MDETYSKLLNYAYFYLKFRPRTEKEVRDYLQKKTEKYGYPTKLAAQVVSELKQQGLINDADFVRRLVEQRSRTKPKSRYALTRELLRYGVGKEIIDGYFAENEPDESLLALQALKKRWDRWSHLPYENRRQKATSFLTNRGFSFSIIKQAIDSLS